MRELPGLTPAEVERLSLLAEECGELIQVIGKILRHGYESRHPNDLNGPTNRGLLGKEGGDVLFALRFLDKNRDVAWAAFEQGCERKSESVGQYLHHQKDSPA